ncbi:hypothetical protein [Sporomusa acidovorans]|uniref:Small, acid-soluble spore protein gamma-type n=1 Tax=Sporomusa acidovorans (strain ATCC 49682 / DSM 3132 / Mol) TaxID=1123286 RepID=A0ABZ3J276_SPOA4|nr:hypothetical protein [Sporomusa acidovorans]OZC19981.1 hypothetical protein SPACI_23780 [Sporomusa acidovorans DSM 3132]SDD48458.1 hypothetical protein SAMN04488499_1001413 [Sporomusa acidovorans]
MPEKKNAAKLMDEATDTAAKALEGKHYQNSGAVTEQFNAKIDKASELASAKYSGKNK